MVQHLVRVGAFGSVGRFLSPDAARFPRGSRVICRTDRGLEVGEVLSAGDPASRATDGSLLRAVTVEDELVLARIQQRRDSAFAACQNLLTDREIPATLIDVEHLFDGRGLYFYFLGPPTSELDTLTDELAETYEAEVQFRDYTRAVTEGCGPGCGTEEATGGGCGTGTCSTCSVSSFCSNRKR